MLLIRHGPTPWNVEGRIQGHTDLSLGPAGRQEVVGWHVPAEFHAYEWVASPLARALETACLLGVGRVRCDPRLAEMSWGEWEGRTWADLRAQYGAAVAQQEARGLDFSPPGGETPRRLVARVRAWTLDITARGHPVAAVTHKGVIQAALAMATGWDLTGKPPYRLDWASAHLFGIHRDGTLAVERLNIGLKGHD
ncbi:MAG: histidine phosphatase family protein [Acidiferrobacterales bacterium]